MWFFVCFLFGLVVGWLVGCCVWGIGDGPPPPNCSASCQEWMNRNQPRAPRTNRGPSTPPCQANSRVSFCPFALPRRFLPLPFRVFHYCRPSPGTAPMPDAGWRPTSRLTNSPTPGPAPAIPPLPNPSPDLDPQAHKTKAKGLFYGRVPHHSSPLFCPQAIRLSREAQEEEKGSVRGRPRLRSVR